MSTPVPSQDKSDDIIFFLGAGASVKAEVPDTFGLVEEFKKNIRDEHEKLEAINKILTILYDWKKEKIDVELLLETLDKMEHKEDEIILKFYTASNYALSGYADKKPLKEDLKDFIKRVAIVEEDKIGYLEPLLYFLNERRSLNIFSVNYDTCIEQFCNVYKKDYVDGFDITWNPAIFNRQDVDIKLYKLHGSVIWYRTDKGNYVKILIPTAQNEVELFTKEKAQTLILYPMRKLEYVEPLLELLFMLKTKLEKAKVAFVVGYSFRDEHIKQIFWNAAKKNKDLIVVLISPHAHEIYEKKLKYYTVKEGGDQIPSPLKDRLIALSYRFEDVFGLLVKHYLPALYLALGGEKATKAYEYKGNIPNWEAVLKQFVDCEYMFKANELAKNIEWQNVLSTDWALAFQICCKALVNSISNEDTESIKFWKQKLHRVFNYFVEHVGVNAPEEPKVIQLVLRLTPSSFIQIKDIAKHVDEILQFTVTRMRIVLDDRKANVEKFLELLYAFNEYLQPWSAEGMNYTSYGSTRIENYREKINEFIHEANEYHKSPSKERAQKIEIIVKEIETSEIRKIYEQSLAAR